MKTGMAIIVEDVIEYLHGMMRNSIDDQEYSKAECIGDVIDWLKNEKNMED